MTLSKEDIFRYNAIGFIPGQGEKEPEFIQRIQYCLDLKEHFFTLFPELKEVQESFQEIEKKELEEAFTLTREFYDIAPDWVALIYSNYALRLWHGGSAWIFQQTENSPTAAFIQLRKVFKTKDRFLGLYSRKELLSHELSHVGRMVFHEKKFEELLAYLSSSSSFQRWFGPILESSHEALMFMSFVLLFFLADLYLIVTSSPFFWSIWWLKLIPLAWIGYGLLRLKRKHSIFKKARAHLQDVTSNPNAVLYRLTDKEIEAFSKMKSEEIVAYFTRFKEGNLRLRFIATVYFRCT